MSIFNNGIEILKIMNNGLEIDKIMNNGIEIFTKEVPSGGTHVLTIGSSGGTWGWFTGQFGDMVPTNIDGQSFSDMSGDDTVFSSDVTPPSGEPDILITYDGDNYVLAYSGVFEQYFDFEGNMAQLVSDWETIGSGNDVDLTLHFDN